jgi:FkbM family methyltransferase
MFKLFTVAAAAVLLRAPQSDVGNSTEPQGGVGNNTDLTAKCPLPAGARWCRLYTGEGMGESLQFACHYDQIQCGQICRTGTWEGLANKLHRLKHSSVPQGSTVLDIGANIGAYSVMSAYYGFKVHAFEPLEMNLELFRASLCANSDVLDPSLVSIHQSLVGDQEGSCSIYQAGHSKGLGVMCCGPAECAKINKPGNTLKGTMPITKLDSVLGTEVTGHIAFMKMDVEGAECQVLNGATKLLAAPFKPDMIQSEVQGDGLRGCTAQQYLDRYSNAGYCVNQKWFQCNEPDAHAIMHGIKDYYMLSKDFKGHV